MTTRGLKETDFEVIAGFVDRAVGIAQQVSKNKFADFKATLGDDVTQVSGLESLKKEVTDFSLSFPAVGFSVDEMKFKD
ncbi:Serine hydroxymethyltransferase, cytosolic [Coemansia sp. RSA 2522]|nr:Serine hydroxymethyltransferase, cytosolic [Coemansia sp. RSA 2522]